VLSTRKARALSSLLVLALAASLFTAAGIAASPDADATVGIGDGCTGVPDEVPGFYDYQGSCDQHDQCYVDDPYGEGEEGRLRCDQEFHQSMQTECAAVHVEGASLEQCTDVADLYYWGVRTFGDIGTRLAEDPDTLGEVVTSVVELVESGTLGDLLGDLPAITFNW